jgi:hypothetical protein
MIVRAAMKSPAFAKLNSEWQDEVVEERSWKIAIPPLWSSLLNEYWDRYARLYLDSPSIQGQLIDPSGTRPGGVIEAAGDLYQPAAEEIEALKERLRAAARAVGAAAAEGAEEAGRQARYGAIAAGLLGLAGVLWWSQQVTRR